jgi:hypothetical protein
MELALRRPARVAALALVCTSATMDRAAWADPVAKVRAGGTAAIADLAMGRFLSPGFVRAHPEIAESVWRGLIATVDAGYLARAQRSGHSGLLPDSNAAASAHFLGSRDLRKAASIICRARSASCRCCREVNSPNMSDLSGTRIAEPVQQSTLDHTDLPGSCTRTLHECSFRKRQEPGDRRRLRSPQAARRARERPPMNGRFPRSGTP